nr:thiol-activated cytolysin C-terminal domain-containing protein [Dawidia cretensis]
MKKVLLINGSARISHSQSRELTGLFVEHWKTVHGDRNIRIREIGSHRQAQNLMEHELSLV